MALFKILKGNEANLPSIMTDGWAYFCTDTSNFFIDYADNDGTLYRAQLNAKDTETLMGASLATILNNNELEIPTSSAVFRALVDNLDAAKAYTDEIVNALDEDYYTKTEIDAQVGEINTTLAQKAQVQIVTWEDDD